MKLRFTKMQGAGNDLIVLDATQRPITLSAEQARRLADRRFGVGADQILLVGPPTRDGIDFNYRIINAGGDEVEHCGNGARCFARYVHDQGLTGKTTIRVETVNNVLELRLRDDGLVSVDMNRPVFEHGLIPFDPGSLHAQPEGDFELWPLQAVQVAVLSMGNPHAVQRVADVDTAPVPTLGPLIEADPHFPRRVNAGFMQVLSRDAIRLRVFERGAGETLACGTGACAAVVAGIRLGWLGRSVTVHTRGGILLIEQAQADGPVLMTGPAVTVYQGEIEL